MINSAAELWTHWTSKNVLRPQDYDQDIACDIAAALGAPSTPYARLAQAMNTAGWSARDLIRAMLPALTSFTGMLTDLLTLYERIGATTTDKDNLRISYEFAAGESIDEQLAPFREKVRRTQTTLSKIETFEFRSSHAWNSPLTRIFEGDLEAGQKVLGIDPNSDLHAWPFTSDVPPVEVQDSRLRSLAEQHRQVILAALARLAAISPNFLSISDARSDETVPALDDRDRDLVQDASDFWAIAEVGRMHGLPGIVANLTPEDTEELMQAHSSWLDGFWRTQLVPIEEQIELVTDILSLPHWGKRFDLYSAWLTSVMDTALAPHRLVFDVSDGVLAFPFRATLLARMMTARGPVELWTEKRFTASHLIGTGRTKNIQPDYVFVDSVTSKVPVVIEAKQYKTGYSKNPGRAAHDYAANLPDANVLIVAHGPLRDDSADLVRPSDRSRVAFHRDVRPGSVAGISKFRQELLALLPPAAPQQNAKQHPSGVSGNLLDLHSHDQHDTGRTATGTVALHWSTDVHDLDLHIIDTATDVTVSYNHLQGAHATLASDAFDGGPELAALSGASGDLTIEVHLYSQDAASVLDATPSVTITTLTESVTLVPTLSASATTRTWQVATVCADGSIEPIDATPATRQNSP